MTSEEAAKQFKAGHDLSTWIEVFAKRERFEVELISVAGLFMSGVVLKATI